MGKHRARDSNKKKKKIQYKIMKEFGIGYDTLYQVWLMFCGYVSNGMSNKQAVEKIQKTNIIEWNKALNYFMCYGLISISFNMNRELKEIK